MRRWCHAGMGWSVVISCFCEMGKQIHGHALQLCSAALEWDCLQSAARIDSHRFQKKQKKKTGRTFGYEDCNQKHFTTSALWPC